MITFTGITNSVDTNQTDMIGILHLYRDGSNYETYATETIYLDTKWYRGVLNDIGSWSEKWNLESDNSVTQSTPSLTLRNEVFPDRSGSVLDTIFDNTYIGNRAVVKLGFRGLALASYVTLYDGKTDDIEVDGENIVVNLKKSELPATHIGGRKINGQFIGTDEYVGSIIVPEESHGRFLPVPFGNHWNAPCVLYRKGVDDSTYWAYCDFDWSTYMNTNASTGIRALAFQRDNLWQAGTYQNQACLLIPNEGKLVPRYQASQTPYAVIFRSLDSGTSNTVGAISVDPPEGDSQQVQYGQQITCNVPLRLYRLSGTGHAADFNNLSPTPSESDIDLMLSDDIDDILTAVSDTAGTWSEVIFNAILDIDKQLRTDSRFCVNPNWPIHIPQPSDTSGGDQWTTLVMGVIALSDGDDEAFESHNNLFAFRVGNNKLTYDLPDPTSATSTWATAYAAGTDWEHFIGYTFVGGRSISFLNQPGYPNTNPINGGQDAGYNYFTHTRLNDGGVAITTENQYDQAADAVQFFANGVADAGNQVGDSAQPDYTGYNLITDKMLDFPYLRRNALDEGVGFRVELRFNDALGDTVDVTAEYKAFYLEAIETINFDWDSDKYTFLKGYQDTDYTGDPVTLSASFADEKYQYLEIILLRKLGVAASGLHSEWSAVAAAYDDFFNDDRTGSGFVTNTEEETPFNEFVKEFCENEPFTVYRDQLGLYRWLQLPIDATSLNGRSYFTTKRDSIDYNDCDLGFAMKFTDKKHLCAEVKECLTDYVYHDGSFAQNQQWKIASGGSYDYSFWDSDNTHDDNKYFVDRIEKRYTSFPEVSRVKNAADSTKGYNCVLTNQGTSIPLVRAAEEDVKYWTPLAGTSADWGSLSSYTASGEAGHWIGWDAENMAIAAYKINQWCNRHRVVVCASQKPEFLKYELGDLIQFQNVPYTCLGLTINGFNGDVSTNEVSVNGQNVYSWFMVTRVTKSLGRVELECMQLHELDAFIINRVSKIPNRRFDGERDIPTSSIGKLGRKLSKHRAFNPK